MDKATAPDEAATKVRSVVDKLDDLSENRAVSVSDIVAAFGDASFLPLMMVPALLVISPLSGIPLFSSLCGLSIGLIAIQMLFRRGHVWLPKLVMRQRVTGTRLRKGVRRLNRIADWLDRNARSRLTILFRYPMILVPQTLCVLCGLSMPFLELIPFSSSLLGTAVVLMSVGFLVRDGVFVIAGGGFVAVAASIPVAVASNLID